MPMQVDTARRINRVVVPIISIGSAQSTRKDWREAGGRDPVVVSGESHAAVRVYGSPPAIDMYEVNC